MLTKHFTGAASATVLLDWDHTPTQMNSEARLSRLAAWVLEAQKAQLFWELRIPGSELPSSCGDAHVQASLTALALHEVDRK
jgi:uncharacterized protein (DUF58 family)